MKKLLKTILLLVILSGTAFGQQMKFAYTNVDYILAYMPEAKTAQVQLKEYETQLTSQIQVKYQTLQQKLADYERDAPGLIEAVRADRERELEQLQTSLQQFQSSAEGKLNQKQAQLLQPLYDKIQDAINDVAKEQGYTFIFRSESLLYGPEGDEISDLIFKKLGITPPSPGGGH